MWRSSNLSGYCLEKEKVKLLWVYVNSWFYYMMICKSLIRLTWATSYKQTENSPLWSYYHEASIISSLLLFIAKSFNHYFNLIWKFWKTHVTLYYILKRRMKIRKNESAVYVMPVNHHVNLYHSLSTTWRMVIFVTDTLDEYINSRSLLWGS